MAPERDLLDRRLNLKTARAWSLVLLAMGIDHSLDEADAGRVKINLAPEDRERARTELRLWRSENIQARWHQRRIQLEPGISGLGLYLVLGLAGIHYLVNSLSSVNLFALGRFDSGALARGEWWRILTAITLHADWGHLLGNAFFGWIMITGLAFSLGAGRSLWVILGGGSFANLINFLIHGPDYRAVGFSNAVFAVWACLVGMTWRKSFKTGLNRGLSLGAGLALFSLLGLGEGSDLTGHLAGLGFGFLCGLGFFRRGGSARGEGILVWGGFAILSLAWVWALIH